jgi:hypothetical protein
MADLKKYPDPVWDRFFDFVFPDEEPATREEVQQELQRRGLDVRKAVAKVNLALKSVQARADLKGARARRPGLTEMLKEMVAPVAGGLRDHLRALIGGKFQGAAQAVYFRKLESAASDEDLQSLLEDLYRLESLQGGPDDVKPAGE